MPQRCGIWIEKSGKNITFITNIYDITNITSQCYYILKSMNPMHIPYVQEIKMEEIQRAAVFIDLNNVEESIKEYKESGMFLDYSNLVDSVTEGMECNSVRIYDCIPAKDNNTLEHLHQRLEAANYELVLKRSAPVENNMNRTCTQKEVDTSLVADVVSMAYEDKYDVAVIVSGDRDMRPAGDCIERIGKKVVYASFYDVMCPDLRDKESSMILDDMYILEASDYSVQPNNDSVATHALFTEVASDA